MPTANHVTALIRAGWDETATTYATDGTGQFELFGQQLVDRLDLRPGTSVLDVATGTGIVARRAAGRVAPQGVVVGVDLSLGMLAMARQAVRASASPVIRFAQMDAGWLGFADESFHTVMCAFSLFQFVDMGRALFEMVRVTQSGGQIGLSTWGPGYFTPVASMQRNLFRQFGLRPLLTNSIVIEPEQLRASMETAGLVEVRLELDAVDLWFESPQAVWDYNCGMGPFVVMLRDQLSRDERHALHERFIDMLSTIATPDGVRCTFHPLYALGRKP